MWRDVARLLSVASRLLDEDLQRGANISLSEYAVLVHLSEAETGHVALETRRHRRPLGKLDDPPRRNLARDGFVVKNRN